MNAELSKRLNEIVAKLGIKIPVSLEYPENPEFGDYTTNIALVGAKQFKASPKKLAEKIVEEFLKNKPDFVDSVRIEGVGFINISVKDEIIARTIIQGSTAGSLAPSSAPKSNPKNFIPKEIMVEYTDPNPFKVFHIGHLMANSIGESISRLIEFSGSKVIRACYQGDIGLHVAKTIWAILHDFDQMKWDLLAEQTANEKMKFLGEMYAYGSKFDDDKNIQKEIIGVNKKIFDGSDQKINEIYAQGKKWSLEYFDQIYKRLGTKFNQFFLESEVADKGMQIVKDFLSKGVFEQSDGAIIFRGENYGLHTRVFITSQGLPTYETKELGLNAKKFELYPNLDQSIIVTANEQNDYFKVVLKAMSLIDSNVASKTKHISHGILRLASGKMSSRGGNVIAAESLIEDIKSLVQEKMASRDFSKKEMEEIADTIAVGAIKYSILRQAIGGDVIFDSAKSISFEGDSGPYLQYSAVRAQSVLEKAVDLENIKFPLKVGLLERLLMRFQSIVERAGNEYAPQHVANYLINIAGAFNNFYGSQKILDSSDQLSPYYIALTRSFFEIMTLGLWLLGIKVPRKM